MHDGRTLAESAARTLAPVCASVLDQRAPGAVNPAAPVDGGGGRAARRARALARAAGGVSRLPGNADLVVLACDIRLTAELLARGAGEGARRMPSWCFPPIRGGATIPWWACGAAALDEIEASLASRIYKVRAILRRPAHPPRPPGGSYPASTYAPSCATPNAPSEL